MPDRLDSLDWAERWLGDGFRVLDAPGGFVLVDVDVSGAERLVARLREQGISATLNHVAVRACALALARHPELHVLVAGTRRLRPARVDIGLSVAGETNFAPVMIIEDAAQKPLPELSSEVARRVPEVREKEQKDLAWLRRWGWLIPFGFLRRAILRRLQDSLWFRRKLSGTFQITCLPVDVVSAFYFNSAASLGVGRARDRVIAVDGRPAVRPVMTLSGTIDHKVWDGARVATLVQEVKRIIEEGELDAELSSVAPAPLLSS